MGFFFLLAGYFTPASLERKGYARFLGDRFLRLGLPLLAFIFILGPTHSCHSRRPRWQRLLESASVSLESRHHHQRPALVCAGAPDVLPRLLRMARAFGIAARTIPAHIIAGSFLRLADQRPDRWRHQLSRYVNLFPSARTSLACSSAILRHTYSSSPSVLQRGATTGFAILLGRTRGPGSSRSRRMAAAAPQHRYLDARFRSRQSKLWRWPYVARNLLRLLGSIRRMGPHRRMAIGLARAWMNKPSQFWSWLNRRAYAVYIIHPPVLVGIALLLHPWVAPALLKFAVTGRSHALQRGSSPIHWCAFPAYDASSSAEQTSTEHVTDNEYPAYNLPQECSHLTSKEDSYGNKEGN